MHTSRRRTYREQTKKLPAAAVALLARLLRSTSAYRAMDLAQQYYSPPDRFYIYIYIPLDARALVYYIHMPSYTQIIVLYMPIFVYDSYLTYLNFPRTRRAEKCIIYSRRRVYIYIMNSVVVGKMGSRCYRCSVGALATWRRGAR